jgi:hypothetical protein
VKRVEVRITLVIEEIGSVKVESVDYITRGSSDAQLFQGSTSSEALVTTEEVVPGPRAPSQQPSNEILALLAGLNLTEDEITLYASTKTERRIRDVATWIKHKNGVASPAGLARKLFAVA